MHRDLRVAGTEELRALVTGHGTRAPVLVVMIVPGRQYGERPAQEGFCREPGAPDVVACGETESAVLDRVVRECRLGQEEIGRGSSWPVLLGVESLHLLTVPVGARAGHKVRASLLPTRAQSWHSWHRGTHTRAGRGDVSS